MRASASADELADAIAQTPGSAAESVAEDLTPVRAVGETIENVAGVPSSMTSKQGYDMMQKIKDKFNIHREQSKAVITSVLDTLANENVVSEEELRILKEAKTVMPEEDLVVDGYMLSERERHNSMGVYRGECTEQRCSRFIYDSCLR